MIVVDSSVWISHFANVQNEQVSLLRAITRPETILMGDLILLEVSQGARSEAAAHLILSELGLFDSSPMLDGEIARRAAKNYRHLRAIGITIRSSVDLIIGTFCIENSHHLLHHDRDFDYMEKHLGLKAY